MHIASIGIDLGRTTFHLVAPGRRCYFLAKSEPAIRFSPVPKARAIPGTGHWRRGSNCKGNLAGCDVAGIRSRRSFELVLQVKISNQPVEIIALQTEVLRSLGVVATSLG